MSSTETDGPGRESQYSRESLIKMIEDYAEQHGEVPTKQEAYGSDFPAPSTFAKYFDSWTDAIIQAGFRPRKSQKYDDGELITHLQAFIDELGRPPTREEFRRADGPPSVGTYEKHFGTFAEALERAGVEANVMKAASEEQLRAVDYVLENDIDGAPLDEIEDECDVHRQTAIAAVTKVRKLKGNLELPDPPEVCGTCGDFADGVVRNGYNGEEVYLCESCAAELVFED
jgi:hypothetical protein